MKQVATPTYKYRGKKPLIPPVNKGEYEVVFILKGFPSFYLVDNAKSVLDGKRKETNPSLTPNFAYTVLDFL